MSVRHGAASAGIRGCTVGVFDEAESALVALVRAAEEKHPGKPSHILLRARDCPRG